jgi:hypothetical protein
MFFLLGSEMDRAKIMYYLESYLSLVVGRRHREAHQNTTQQPAMADKTQDKFVGAVPFGTC